MNRLSGEEGARQASEMGRKHRPRVAGQGENLPLDALRFLSDWTAVLEERGTVPGLSFRLFYMNLKRGWLMASVMLRDELGSDDWLFGSV